MRSIIALMRQREYFVQAIRRTLCVTSSPPVERTTLLQSFSFLTTLISSTESLDDKRIGSDGEEELNNCLSLRIEKLPKGVTVGSALQSWMSDGFPVHGGDVYHSINRLRKPGRNKRALEETRMRDRFTLYARGGEGGNGCASVRRSRTDRYGKPDGGNGGRGGDVILECTQAVWDFSGLQPHVKGGKAGQGASKNRIGNRGEDKVLQVPIGTVIHLQEGEIPSQVQTDSHSPKDLDPWDIPGTLVEDSASEEEEDDTNVVHQEVTRESVQDETEKESVERYIGTRNEAASEENEGENDEVRYNVAELTEQGQRIIIARGGEGGLGSVCATRYVRGTKFAKTATLRSMVDDSDDDNDERSSIKSGSLGSECVLILELKSIADVGLVGMPNAGKSTLLGALSRAKPRVGHYAFTTLRPNLGKVNYEEFSMTVADIPGLIKGAHQNRGLGHNFLRHIERTKVLAYVVDLASGLDGCRGITPWQQLKDLVMELEFHEEGLSDRASLIVANKIDEIGADERLKELEKRVKGVKIYPVCAVLEEGVDELKDGLKMLVNGDCEH